MFNSNTTPSRFGFGREPRKEWECLCGHINRAYLNFCMMCEIGRDFALDAKEKIDAKRQAS